MSKSLKIATAIFAGFVLLAVIFVFGAGISPLGMNLHAKVQNKDGIAIAGYDVVNYHLNGKAIKGSGEFSNEWKGVRWQFRTQAHLDSFKITPEAFAPSCGGYCAFAVGRGFAAGSNPEFWTIENGKLYFFSDETVKADWLKNKESEIASVKENWK
jgi:YHS domain-containing protein